MAEAIAQQQTLDEVLEIVRFLKDNMPMRSEMEHGFDDIRAEIQAVRKELEELKEEVRRLDKRVTEDTDAIAHELVDFKKQLAVMEQRVRQLELARSV